MTIRLSPYLQFNGKARRAMEFYQTVFGGELALSTFADTGVEGPKGNEIMHGMLETDDGLVLMGADAAPGMGESDPVNDFSISLSGSATDDARLREYWSKLSETGTVTVPLEPQMWGDTFGMCVDSFGINWMVNIGK